MAEAQTPQPTVAAVIVNYRTPDLALAALESLAASRTAFPALRVVLVDGGSQDGSAEQLAAALASPSSVDWVTFLPLAINGGFGWANNQAFLSLLNAPVPPDYIFLLNPDAQVEPGAIETLVQSFELNPHTAAIGSLLLNEDGSPSGSAFRFPSPAREFARGIRIGGLARLFRIDPTLIVADALVEADWVTGASVMFRAAALSEVGLFDSGFFLYFEEVELMWRLRNAGWAIMHQPASRVRHIGGAATKLTYNKRNLTLAPPLPDYWFRSRRRMFALTRGTVATVMANLLWLSGHAVFSVLRRLGLKRSEQVNREEARSLIRNGLWPTSADLTPQRTGWSDIAGAPPAWIETER